MKVDLRNGLKMLTTESFKIKILGHTPSNLRTEDGKEEICIGSIELINEIEKSVDKGFMNENIFSEFKLNDLSDENYSKIDLHKNVVDSKS